MKAYFLFIIISLCVQCSSFLIAKSEVPLSWEELGELNIDTGEMTPSLTNKMNKKVAIGGFIVPLESDGYLDKVKEFMLIPQPLACYHVPLPPANQIVYVKMKKAIPLDIDRTGVEIKGVLSQVSDDFSDDESVYSFLLEGISAKEADIEVDYFEDELVELDFLFN